MLEIATYRHKYSTESKLRQAELLQNQLNAISNQRINFEQKLLMIARVMQPHLPFDYISFGPRPATGARFEDVGYLRIGFDEYQYIDEEALATITRVTKKELSLVMGNSLPGTGAVIYSDEFTTQIPEGLSMQRMLFNTFALQCCLLFPVTLTNGLTVHYVFYSKRPDAYTPHQIALLQLIKIYLTKVAEEMNAGALADEQTVPFNSTDITINRPPEYKDIIGSHPLLLNALDLTSQVAAYNTSVLILGESGTGKEKVAEFIHMLSPRKNRPFIKVNCAAIPATLFESELFGHEKGAFTGALEKRVGKFEQAHGGTIFLDEIGELPTEMQVKLLRVLQEKEVESIGGSSPVKVDVRIVAATNRNLEKEIADGNFRLDLYFRLNVFPILLPALRQRQSDIAALALFFANKFCKEFNKPFIGISSSMMEEMIVYHWPGNIRELQNVLEQAVILNDGKSELKLMRGLYPLDGEKTRVTNIETFEDVKNIQQQTEREYIISILKKTNGRVRGIAGAAELLHIKPSTLESKMAKLNIKRENLQ
jgi:transcriptional regulator with GAF, ATPase, and Fis domain